MGENQTTNEHLARMYLLNCLNLLLKQALPLQRLPLQYFSDEVAAPKPNRNAPESSLNMSNSFVSRATII